MAYGFIGVLIFALTLPATRLAVAGLDPVWVALGRVVVAALLALPILLVTRQVRPAPTQARLLMGVMVGVVFGFPLFTSLAMQRVDASHGAVVLGLLPIATAMVGAWQGGERLPRAFWACAAVGAALVLGYALIHSQGRPGWADGYLLLAVASSALGYASGGKLSRSLGGWQTIAWALVFGLPLSLPIFVGLSLDLNLAKVPLSAWLGFGYLTVFSQLLGFLFWYGGMARAGVARVSQVQLLQLFLTLIFSAAINGEYASADTWGVALLVVGLVWFIRRLPAA